MESEMQLDQPEPPTEDLLQLPDDEFEIQPPENTDDVKSRKSVRIDDSPVMQGAISVDEMGERAESEAMEGPFVQDVFPDNSQDFFDSVEKEAQVEVDRISGMSEETRIEPGDSAVHAKDNENSEDDHAHRGSEQNDASSARPSMDQSNRKHSAEAISRQNSRQIQGEQERKRRPTRLSYGELGPRIVLVPDDIIDFGIDNDFALMLDESVEVEEEISVVEEEQQPTLDRKPYYERYDELTQSVEERRIKNNILQKKLSMFFKRKKIDYSSREGDSSQSLLNGYLLKLTAYGEIMDFIALERAKESDEIRSLKETKQEKRKKLQTMFKKMQSREAEIGYGLIYFQTAKEIPEKLVERLINRQSRHMEETSTMRLKFIRLKQMVQEKLDAIAALNEVAPGFLLATYEHLKALNRGYIDKIEEKDEELNKLRTKCSSTIQILAHVREKSEALESDVVDFYREFEDANERFAEVREKLNVLKQRRDYFRNGITKIKNESGLLTQPTLLRDMEQGLIDVQELSRQLKQTMTDYKKRAAQIKLVREKIEVVAGQRRLFGQNYPFAKSGGLRTIQPSKVYRGRPSLIMPDIDEAAFDELKSIKPEVTMDRKRYTIPRCVKKNKVVKN